MNTWSLTYRNKHYATGNNALCVDDPRLFAKWQWSRHSIAYDGYNATKWTRCPGQCSEADLGNGLMLKVIEWHNYYEAELMLNEDTILHTNALEEGGADETINTRLKAQLVAEKLVERMMKFLEVRIPTKE